MAFLEWKRFNFFDKVLNIDGGKVSDCLKEKTIIDASSGYGHLVFGDSEGGIHLVKRNFEVTSFNAYTLRVCLVKQLRHVSLLVTIGEDEPGINPLIKVWNLDKLDKQGFPMCVRISRAIPNNQPTPATVLCVHENLNLMAVGFSNGSIVLYRGDITRVRSVKHKTLRDGGIVPVTGLEFRSTAKFTYLFVATSSGVFLYNVTVKDKEEKTDLRGAGCEENCSTLAESMYGGHFMIGRNDAVYCYTPDGRGPCYIVEGQKVKLAWFRNYLVIVSKDNENSTWSSTNTSSTLSDSIRNNSSSDMHTITILDIQNKFIVMQYTVRDFVTVLSEWGSLYVVCGRAQKELLHLQEKGHQTKLNLLFKKNLYDVAIRIAKSHHYDADGIADIFRQYGDHVYSKGDHAGAIEHYMRTIGRLEPSYVIRKYLDSQHIENLTTYLQALHKEGHASEDHTTLLLNCYTKLDKTDRLKEFIMTKDREIDFDVEIAIKVCRQSSSEDALFLAQKHGMHDWYLKIQIEDHKNYNEALEYIAKLEFYEAEANMKKYGGVLLKHSTEETTQFLKKLCSNYVPSNNFLGDTNMLQGIVKPVSDRGNPEDFIHLFTDYPQQLEEFLEYLLQENTKWNALVSNTLLEHYLNEWGSLQSAGTVETSKRIHYEKCVMRLLENSDASYDRDQVLILCRANNFRPGLLYLLEGSHLYQQIVQYHMVQQDYQAVLASCEKFGNQDPNLWEQALWYFAGDASAPPDVLNRILQVIEQKKSMPPLLVLDALCASSHVTLATVRGYLLNVLQSENELIKSEQKRIQECQEQSEQARQKIETIQTKSVIFQVSRCSACEHPLELPSIHFLCLHSYHQHCFQSYSENENECPSCLPQNKKILDVIKAQECVLEQVLHDEFHDRLDRAEDGFSVVADYFGRGVFNKFTVVTDTLPDVPIRQISSVHGEQHNYGAGAEARVRLQEKPSSYGVFGEISTRLQPSVNLASSSHLSRAPSNLPSSQPSLKPIKSSPILASKDAHADYKSTNEPKLESWPERKSDLRIEPRQASLVRKVNQPTGKSSNSMLGSNSASVSTNPFDGCDESMNEQKSDLRIEPRQASLVRKVNQPTGKSSTPMLGFSSASVSTNPFDEHDESMNEQKSNQRLEPRQVSLLRKGNQPTGKPSFSTLGSISASVSTNPIDYDESLNPFAKDEDSYAASSKDDGYSTTTNSIEDSTDYDKNLNPFANE